MREGGQSGVTKTHLNNNLLGWMAEEEKEEGKEGHKKALLVSVSRRPSKVG